MARPIEITDLITGKKYHFNKIVNACELLKTTKGALNSYLREAKSGKPYRGRYIIVYSDYVTPEEDNEPIKVTRNTKKGIWKLSQSKQFPNVLVAEARLPFFNEDYFNIIRVATKAFFNGKNYMIWIDDVTADTNKNDKWERTFSKMQILFKFDCNTSFSYKIKCKQAFLDKMELLIKGLNELKQENEIDELYARFKEE